MAQKSEIYADVNLRSVGDATSQVAKNFMAVPGIYYKAGDFVIIDSNGYAVKNTALGGVIDGIIHSDVDNTSDIYGAMVPVTLKGNVWIDLFITPEQSYSDAAYIGAICSTSGDGGVTADDGQAVSVGGSGDSLQFTSLAIQPTPATAPILRKALFYFRGSNKFG